MRALIGVQYGRYSKGLIRVRALIGVQYRRYSEGSTGSNAGADRGAGVDRGAVWALFRG